MKVILKHQFYFELEVEDGTDRTLVSGAFEKTLRPQFDEFLSKIKFDDSDQLALFKLTGKKVKVRIISASQFKKSLVQDSSKSV